MKFKILRSELMPALVACATVAHERAVKPEHACAVFRLSDDGLAVRATNHVQSVEVDLGAVTGHGAGVVAVNAADLLARVGAMSEGEIEFSAGQRSLEMKQPGRRFSLAIYDALTTPVARVDAFAGATINAAALATLLGRVAPAMCADTSRPSMCGVHLLARDGRVSAAATDSRSAAMAWEAAIDEVDVLIPAEAVGHVRKILAKRTGAARVGVVGSSMFVEVGQLRYSSLLTADPFMGAVRPILAGGARKGYAVTVATADLCAAIDAIRAAKPYQDHVLIDGSEGLHLRARGEHGDEAEAHVDSHGGLQLVAASATMVAGAAKFFTGDKIVISHDVIPPKDLVSGGSAGPLFFTDAETGDAFLVAPLRFRDDEHRSPSRKGSGVSRGDPRRAVTSVAQEGAWWRGTLECGHEFWVPMAYGRSPGQGCPAPRRGPPKHHCCWKCRPAKPISASAESRKHKQITIDEYLHEHRHAADPGLPQCTSGGLGQR